MEIVFWFIVSVVLFLVLICLVRSPEDEMKDAAPKSECIYCGKKFKRRDNALSCDKCMYGGGW